MAIAKGLIFDFDGTIALSEPVHMLAWEQLAHEEEIDLPHGFLESGIGRTDQQLCIELSLAVGGRFSAPQLLKMKRSYYQALAAQKSTLVPNADVAIKTLNKMLPMAIATSACLADIMPTLNAFKLAHYFQAILTVDDVKNPKPDPEIYLKAAARINCKPEECWAFEDSIPGITAANAAGMTVVAMLTAYRRDQLPKTTHAISDYKDLPALLKVMGHS